MGIERSHGVLKLAQAEVAERTESVGLVKRQQW